VRQSCGGTAYSSRHYCYHFSVRRIDLSKVHYRITVFPAIPMVDWHKTRFEKPAVGKPCRPNLFYC